MQDDLTQVSMTDKIMSVNGEVCVYVHVLGVKLGHELGEAMFLGHRAWGLAV